MTLLIRSSQHAGHDRHRHPEAHLAGVCQHIGKDLPTGRRVHSRLKYTGGEFEKVVQHPAGDIGIVHHQQIAAQEGKPSVNMPLGAGLFQCAIGQDSAFAAGPANGQLHRQHWQPQDHQHDQIQQHKQPAAVLPDDKREPPHIADAHCAARADEQETQSGFKRFSLHIFAPLFCCKLPPRKRHSLLSIKKSAGLVKR